MYTRGDQVLEGFRAQQGVRVSVGLSYDKSNKNEFPHLESHFLKFDHQPFISRYIYPGPPSFDLPTPNSAGSLNLISVPGSGPGKES